MKLVAAVTVAGLVLMQASTRNVWTGVYTTDQAARGKERFAMYCTRCHLSDLSGGENPSLRGNLFLAHWMEDSMKPLYDKMRKMPPQGEKPPDDAYVDLLAYILQVNTFPPGSTELKANAVEEIMLTGRDGPGPVPDSALVEVVGCLSQNTAGAWLLTNASEPVRTHDPARPTDNELKSSANKPLGKHTFLLLSPRSFKSGFAIDAYKNHKMHGRGLLIRTAEDERLNITWLENLASTCP
jgi:S-disulfanyl-L-cysteine oxidoreductase SoxD